MEKINLAEKLAKVSERWSPKTVADMNDYEVKIVKVLGEFIWHDHANTDEFFLVLDGQLIIRLIDGEVVPNPGELYVVPRGKKHCPFASQETQVLLIERRETVNTGDVVDKLTVSGERI